MWDSQGQSWSSWHDLNLPSSQEPINSSSSLVKYLLRAWEGPRPLTHPDPHTAETRGRWACVTHLPQPYPQCHGCRQSRGWQHPAHPSPQNTTQHVSATTIVGQTESSGPHSQGRGPKSYTQGQHLCQQRERLLLLAPPCEQRTKDGQGWLTTALPALEADACPCGSFPGHPKKGLPYPPCPEPQRADAPEDSGVCPVQPDPWSVVIWTPRSHLSE